MSTEQNKNTIRHWVEEAWNKGNLAVVDEVYASNYVQHEPPGVPPVTSSAALKGYVTAYRTALPDIHFTIDDLIAEGDKAVVRFTTTGTQRGELFGIPPTGKSGKVPGIVIFRFQDGKIAEGWVLIDSLLLLQQVGVVPTPGQPPAKPTSVFFPPPNKAPCAKPSDCGQSEGLLLLVVSCQISTRVSTTCGGH